MKREGYFPKHSQLLAILFALIGGVLSQGPLILSGLVQGSLQGELDYWVVISFIIPWAGMIAGAYGWLTKNIIGALMVGFGPYLPGTLFLAITALAVPLGYAAQVCPLD